MRIRSQHCRRAHPQAGAIRETRGIRDGPLSVWFYHSLRIEGLPAICIDARHAKAALDMATNKTDANDADGLAQLAEVGFFREVRVKGFDSMLTRAVSILGIWCSLDLCLSIVDLH